MVTFNSAETAENKLSIASATYADHTLRSMKMEGCDDVGLNLNTVECLRGRLLAERQASRVAKSEEESMVKKLAEVEKLLGEEIKLREKAERKLRFLRKKLKSFNISPNSKEHSDSSEICEAASCASSSSTAATAKDCDSQITTDNSSCDSEPVVFSLPEIRSESPNPSSEDLKNDESRLGPSLSSRSSVTENEDEKGNSCDNSMALVPVNVTGTSHAPNNTKQVAQSVLDVLDALRHARERLQSSMSTRQMIQVGPA